MWAFLDWSLPVSDTIQVLRVIACALAGYVFLSAIIARRGLGGVRLVVYLTIAVTTFFQEIQQYHDRAAFLVWRLPAWYVLLVGCAWSMYGYQRGSQR